MSVELSATTDLNGGGNAAFIHVFQLADNAAFRTAPYEAFWQSPEQALGGSMVSTSQVQLFPDASEVIRLDLAPNVRFVGVAANLRDPDRDRWRALYSVEELRGGRLHITVGSDGMSGEL